MSQISVRQRWSVLHLSLHRGRTGTAEATLSFRRVDGRTVWDRKLRWGRVDVPPGSSASADPIVAAAAALWAVTSPAEHEEIIRTWTELGASAPAPPGGPRGGLTR